MTRRSAWMTAAILLGLFFLLSLGSAVRESPVYDEPIHLVSGMSFWKTGRYNLNPLHPPVLRLWATFPLFIMQAPWPVNAAARFRDDALSLAHIWLFLGPQSVDYYLGPARLMVILLGVGLGCLIWVWAGQAYGTVAAIAALTAFAFCPALLAYSHYVTTDFAPAAVSTLLLYVFWLHTGRSPARWRWLLEGALAGLAVSTKFTEVIMLPLIGMILLATERRRLTLAAMGFQAAGFVGVTLLAYGVTQTPYFFAGLHSLFKLEAVVRFPEYFHGSFTDHDWPWFLSALFLIKTPIPFLFLTGAGFILLLKPHAGKRRTGLVWWIFPCFFYLLVCSLAHYQLGIRRILILYPLLCLWIGWVVSVLWEKRPVGPAICVFLSVWYASSTLRAFPNYISYFNEWAGRSKEPYAVDCNLDWGQGLKALASYLKQRQVSAVYFSYFGCGDPHGYGIRYVPVAGANTIFLTGDPPAVLAGESRKLFVISATNRVGLYYLDHRLFQWLDAISPIDKVADSLWVYDITHREDLERRLLDIRQAPPRMAVES